jgi:putative restriction endonuclease
MAKRRLWTREEMILAFSLYLRLPFGKMHYRTTEIIELASLIKRTPSAVAMRLVNFAAVDPFHIDRGVKGLKAGSKRCKPIFEEFVNNRDELLYESEYILAKYQGVEIEEKYKEDLSEIDNYVGETKIRYVKTRVNQHLFRSIVLNIYDEKCAFTGINIKPLLIASHIKPWAADAENRLNPSNGICLNTLHDKAFDKGLIGIDLDYKIVFSNYLKEFYTKDFYNTYFKKIEGNKLTLPNRFKPQQEFIEYHMNNCFDRIR